MRAIKRNIVGLLKFSGLLFTLILPRRPEKLQEGQGKGESQQEQDKYMNIIKQPSVPLIPTETVFCPKCHVPVAQVRHTKQGTEIIQNGKVLITVGANIIAGKGGREAKGFPIRCPNGHTVRIE